MFRWFNTERPARKPVDISTLPKWSDLKEMTYVDTAISVDTTLNSRVMVYKGDITNLKIDAIANAANSGMRGGGGVDGCIHDAAGDELLDYLRAHCAHCPTGSFFPSPGFKIPCKQILHGVGPIGEEPKLLSSVYEKCMDYCKKNNLMSVAFPCISTGIFGYSNTKACPVVLNLIRTWLDKNRDWNGVVMFCCYSQKDTDTYMENLPKFFPKYTKTEFLVNRMKICLEREKNAIEKVEYKIEKRNIEGGVVAEFDQVMQKYTKIFVQTAQLFEKENKEEKKLEHNEEKKTEKVCETKEEEKKTQKSLEEILSDFKKVLEEAKEKVVYGIALFTNNEFDTSKVVMMKEEMIAFSKTISDVAEQFIVVENELIEEQMRKKEASSMEEEPPKEEKKLSENVVPMEQENIGTHQEVAPMERKIEVVDVSQNKEIPENKEVKETKKED
ncbi:hypothetical protein EIN_044550 [Entamoeba invadens IP1]|uniref:Macro domain-containing protein n=1 Tax=Entamoeba invadens IP1 TaxID=370355 RepID=A0A0A1TZ95_ENTIV|nr:hypothetical protein EIN_044550 [Entamoeba invadens IP1]ELP86897.1 hypothetical protein EIN_044550 [Entamoeba invadens IP1]|eukprot:XP_004253668.1 hypothetical protein EIN_044550 [Entamoeba invadens IP1]